MVTCRIKIFLILLLFNCFFLGAESKTKQLDEIYENIITTYSKIKFYEADFLQENYWKDMDLIKSSVGKVYFDVDHFCLQYSEPAGQLLLITGNEITIYDAASRQAMISNNIETELRPDRLISEYWQNSEKYLIFNENNLTKLKLKTPNREQISIILQDFLILEILILDADQNFVQYKFKNARINEMLPQDIFQLSLPEDTTIIDNRG